MSERIRNVVSLAVILVSIAVVITVLVLDGSADSDRAQSLAARLKCPVCTSESVADSPSQVSRDLYALIEEQVASGWSDDEIVTFFVERYGDEVQLDPPASGATSALWITPLAALAVGGVVIAGRRARYEREPSPEELSRIAAELEDSDR